MLSIVYRNDRSWIPMSAGKCQRLHDRSAMNPGQQQLVDGSRFNAFLDAVIVS